MGGVLRLSWEASGEAVARDAREERTMGLRVAAVLGVLMLSAAVWAGDTSALRPPAGAKVALVAFEDLQCPDCADAEALLQEAVAKYKIPLVRHDFPLPQHNWSFEAHVMARYFDTKSAALGEEFRRWVFANQTSMNKENLRGMGERFADQHGMELPANLDSTGELKNKVLADYALGQQAGVVHTPTVFVVSAAKRGAPFVETLDRAQLFAMIEQLQADAK